MAFQTFQTELALPGIQGQFVAVHEVLKRVLQSLEPQLNTSKQLLAGICNT